MNPKEKAKELVDKYLDLFKKTDTCFLDDCPTSVACQHSRYKCKGWLDYAKECAKIAVKELIEAFKQLSIEESGRVKIDFGHGYWESVLKEIDNL